MEHIFLKETNSKIKYLVVQQYISAFPNPITLKIGDIVEITDKKSDWKGWIWCQTKDHTFGWVPENIITRTGTKGKIKANYDATELSAEIGDRLELIKKESKWIYCKTSSGELGWIPENNAKVIQP